MEEQVKKIGKNKFMFSPDHPRFVIFSESKGIFLGWHGWSFAPDSSKHYAAKTMLSIVADKIKVKLAEDGLKDTILVQVKPDYKFGLASPEACESAGLPGWHYDVKYGDPSQHKLVKDENDPADEDTELSET
jgi:hypothetical protein